VLPAQRRVYGAGPGGRPAGPDAKDERKDKLGAAAEERKKLILAQVILRSRVLVRAHLRAPSHACVRVK